MPLLRGRGAARQTHQKKQAGLQWERWRRAHLEDLLEGMTPMEFILRFTFTNPDLDTTIVGTINPAHLQTNLEILQKGPLSPELYEEAKRRFTAAGSAPQSRGEL